jgi:hypothetical protein
VQNAKGAIVPTGAEALEAKEDFSITVLVPEISTIVELAAGATAGNEPHAERQRQRASSERGDVCRSLTRIRVAPLVSLPQKRERSHFSLSPVIQGA